MHHIGSVCITVILNCQFGVPDLRLAGRRLVADRPGKYDKVKSVGELRDCETMGTDIGREEFLVELHIALQAPVELAGLPAIP